MAEFGAEKRVIVGADRSSVAEAVAARFVRRARSLTAKKVVHVSLTGGSMGEAVLAGVARHPDRDSVDWSRVHFWWSDERFVPRHDADRNEKQARGALLDALTLPPENIHAIVASDDNITAQQAAERYADELNDFAGAQPWPAFDICFLGVGPDAHIASLFPDRPEISITDRAAVVVENSPKPPPTRVTLTRPVINSSERIWLVLAGADKASALGLALAGASYTGVPAAGARGTRRTIFFVDRDAADQVPAELIAREY